jgi:hypothetical protein
MRGLALSNLWTQHDAAADQAFALLPQSTKDRMWIGGRSAELGG